MCLPADFGPYSLLQYIVPRSRAGDGVYSMYGIDCTYCILYVYSILSCVYSRFFLESPGVESHPTLDTILEP